MKLLLVLMLAITFSIGSETVFAESPTYFDSVKFIQYLDENTALEEVRKGNLDIYYYRMSSDRLESDESRAGLNVFDSTGGSYSILANPAETEQFNPFAIKDIRFALNYLIDRKLIVNELMGGYGAPMISYYGPHNPEYLSIIGHLEAFNFKYNPTLANNMIENTLLNQGAKKINDVWVINDTPIEITIFIRSDDPVRKSIGEILASELEKIGFKVKKEFGDLNKAFVVVYGSDPADLKWSLYTEGWAQSAFVKYDSVGIGQMYAPWFSNMPGFNDPTYWNYENEKLDLLTQKIYTGDFNSAKERTNLIQDAIIEGVNESVRIFVASKIDQYVTNEKIEGVVNDFGAGVPSRFTPINAKTDNSELIIGVKQISQGAWNPVMGFSDSYSRHIWSIISDPITFKHPFSGETIPIRGEWLVETAGPSGKLEIPKDAIIWNPSKQKWEFIDEKTNATSKVIFDFKFSNWHNGQKMDMNDILYSLYFTLEWGTKTSDVDKTFDTEFTPRASQIVDTIKGIKQIDDDTLEVYVDYWHFDEGEITDWASLWSTMPWEIFSAMGQAVLDGKVSFSRSGAPSKNVSWLSLIIPKDSKIIQDYLETFSENRKIPKPLERFIDNENYSNQRYLDSINWIKKNNHAVISNGPYFLKSYSPESRTITVLAFNDESYPFSKGYWSKFENAETPKITEIKIPEIMIPGREFEIMIEVKNSHELKYFITDGKNNLLSSNLDVHENLNMIKLSHNDTMKFASGAGEIKVFAISDTVLKPDFYSKGFLITETDLEKLPVTIADDVEVFEKNEELAFFIIPAIIAIIAAVFLKLKNYRKP